MNCSVDDVMVRICLWREDKLSGTRAGNCVSKPAWRKSKQVCPCAVLPCVVICAVTLKTIGCSFLPCAVLRHLRRLRLNVRLGSGTDTDLLDEPKAQTTRSCSCRLFPIICLIEFFSQYKYVLLIFVLSFSLSVIDGKLRSNRHNILYI